ncbi:MAG: hypothetical protein ABI288_02265 [Ginsengibacter sp.]
MVVAACFYSPDVYEKLLKISDDRAKMCDSYEDWLVQFMKMKNGLEEQNLSLHPVPVHLEKLVEFCKKNKLLNTGEARSKYASQLAEQIRTLERTFKSKMPQNDFTLSFE